MTAVIICYVLGILGNACYVLHVYYFLNPHNNSSIIPLRWRNKLRLSRSSNFPMVTLQGSGRSRICMWDSFMSKSILLTMTLNPFSNDSSFKNWDPNAEAATSQRFVNEKPRD